MAVALFSEMSHPHGDPNTGASAARFARTGGDGDRACAPKNGKSNVDPENND